MVSTPEAAGRTSCSALRGDAHLGERATADLQRRLEHDAAETRREHE